REGTDTRFAARLYPSPLHDRSVLSFSTTRRGPAQVTLYDVSGRAVRALVPETDLGPGRHDVAIDGRDDRGVRLAPGVYLYPVPRPESPLPGGCGLPPVVLPFLFLAAAPTDPLRADSIAAAPAHASAPAVSDSLTPGTRLPRVVKLAEMLVQSTRL